MRKAIENIQNKASDEQKLFFAMLASVSVATLLFVIWFAGLQSGLKSGAANKTDTTQNMNAESEIQKERSIKGQSEAGALGALGDSFYDLTQKQKLDDKKYRGGDEIKRQPFKLEI